MPYASVTVSASSGIVASTPVALNWRSGRPVLWAVTVNSSVAIGDFTVQYSLDDLQLTTYSTAYPPTGSPTAAPTNVWLAVSSYAYTTVGSTGMAGTHFTSSTIFPDGIFGTFLAPPCAMRLHSTGTSSSILTLRVVQADGG